MHVTDLKRPVRLLRSVFALAIVFALAACGGESSNPDDAVEADAEVLIRYSGAREGETAIGNLSLYCGNEGMPNTVNTLEIYMMNQPVNVNMVIPADLEPGTYEVVGSDDNMDFSGATPQASFEWRDFENSDLANYDAGKGELTIEQIPTAQGEPFIATLKMDFTSEEGETVSTTIEFDGDAGYQSFDEC